MTRFVRLICLLGGVIVFVLPVAEFLAQSVASPETPQNVVVLSKLLQPIYPPLARQTRITGDVHLMLKVRLDGSVESATVVSGHPLLQQAALESAQKSQFECRKCDEAASIELVYTFQLAGPENCCTAPENQTKNDQADHPIPRVIQSQNHVTVVDRGICICGPGSGCHKGSFIEMPLPVEMQVSLSPLTMS